MCRGYDYPVKGCGQVDSVVTSKGTVTVRSICSLDARGPGGSGLGVRNGAKDKPDPPLKPAGGSGFKPLRPFDSLPLQPAAGSGFKPLRPFDSLCMHGRPLDWLVKRCFCF